MQRKPRPPCKLLLATHSQVLTLVCSFFRKDQLPHKTYIKDGPPKDAVEAVAGQNKPWPADGIKGLLGHTGKAVRITFFAGAGAEEPEPAHVRVYALTAEAYAADVDAQLKLLGGLGLRGVRFARLPHEAIAEE